MSSRSDKLELLWKKIASATEEQAKMIIDQLDEETLNELYTNKNIFNKSINPDDENDKVALFSYVNMPRKYTVKLVTTAMVGFMYQMVIEFEHKSAESLPSKLTGELGNMIYKVREEFRINKPVQLYSQKLGSLRRRESKLDNMIKCLGSDVTKPDTDNSTDNIIQTDDTVEKLETDLTSVRAQLTECQLLYKQALIQRYNRRTKAEKPEYDKMKDTIKSGGKTIKAIKKAIKRLTKQHKVVSAIKPQNRGELRSPEDIEKDLKDYSTRLKDNEQKHKTDTAKLIAYESKLNKRDNEIDLLEREIKQISANKQCSVPELPKIDVDDDDEAAILNFCKEHLKITQTKEERIEEIQDYLLDFLDYHFKYDPNNHVHQGYMPHYDTKLRSKIAELPRHKSGMVITENFAEILVPPADTFYSFNNYFDTNYETIRQACHDIYGDQSPYENMIIFHKDFDGPNAEANAKAWKLKHRNILDLDVYQTKFHRWTLMDSWKDNRDNIDIYNRDTRLIEEIIDQCKQDERIGGDIIKKRARKGKNTTAGIKDFDKKYPSKAAEYGVKKVDDIAIPKDTGKLGKDEVKINVINTGARRRGRRMVPTVSKWKFHVPSAAPEAAPQAFNPAQYREFVKEESKKKKSNAN